MGITESRESRKSRDTDFINKCKELKTFHEKYLPEFMDSEYCRADDSAFIDPVIFQIAFTNYLRMRKINIPDLVYKIDPNSETLKYYLNVMKAYKNTNIYVSGSCKYNVLVGITIIKWPGSEKTDIKAKMLSELSHL